MLSHKHKCIFIHIPKTAGQSIEQSLDPKAFAARGQGIYGHQNLLMGNYPHFPEYFKFTVVRNPWDRVLSAYLYDISQANNGFTFDSRKFINNHLGPTRDGFCQFVTRYLDKLTSNLLRLHYIPQYKWISTVKNFDYVCRFETLQEDFNIICDKLGIPRRQLPHVNKSGPARDYKEYYNDAAKEEIACRYNIDITTLNYKFS
jgi:chondroitin 4-sulfotransferase 11